MKKRYKIEDLRLMNRNNGFTLIEVLISISIIIVVGVIVGSIIISTLRGSTKATVLSDVKQNGNYAITEMSRVIRSATNINNPVLPCGNPSSAAQTITVTQLDTSQVTFDCSSGNTITESQNGGTPVALLNASTTKLVPNSCKIICSQQTAADIPSVQIQFSLTQSTTANFAEQSATVPFQTTILLRNIQ